MPTFDEIKALVIQKDEIVNQKFAEVQGRIDHVEAAYNRVGNQLHGLGNGNASSADEREHKNSFLNSFIRKGIDNGLRDMEIRAAVTDGSDPDGGYGIPVELDRNIDKILRNAVAMRRISNVISAGIGYHRLVSTNAAASGWVGETDERPVTANPQLIKLSPFFGELYANPAASQNSLDDIGFDVESWLQESVAEEFIAQEGSAFLTGDGTKKPKGLLAYATAATADGVRAFGTIEHVVSGNASSFPTVTATYNPYDSLLDLVGALKAQYRQNAKWLLNKKTLTYLRKLKTTLEGEYIISPTMAAPGTILGYEYVEDEGMPDIGAGSLPIAFGDFSKAYTIVDVMGTRVLRDPYTSKPFVNFYSTKRTGGFLSSSEAVKVLKISA